MAVLLDPDSPEIDIVYDQHLLELTFYEPGNMLWKVAHLQYRIDDSQTEELLSLFQDFRNEVLVHNLPTHGMKAVLETAKTRDITFYDASYLYCVKELDATILSEDEELQKMLGELFQYLICAISLSEFCYYNVEVEKPAKLSLLKDFLIDCLGRV